MPSPIHEISTMGPDQEESRRARRRIVVAAAIYAPALITARAGVDGGGATTALLLVALAAGLAMFYYAVRSVHYGDELQQLIHFKALAIAFVGLAVTSFLFALAPDFGVERVPQAVRWIDLWILLSTLWLLGMGWAHWRHR